MNAKELAAHADSIAADAIEKPLAKGYEAGTHLHDDTLHDKCLGQCDGQKEDQPTWRNEAEQNAAKCDQPERDFSFIKTHVRFSSPKYGQRGLRDGTPEPATSRHK